MSAKKNVEEPKVAEEDSVDLDNPAYIGVSPEYKNSANVSNQPFLSGDTSERDKELNAADSIESLARSVNPNNPSQTYDPGTVHPSEAVKPQDAYIEGNRAFLKKLTDFDEE